IHALAGGGASDVWASGIQVHHWDGSRWTEPSVPTVVPRAGGTGILWLDAAPGGHTFGADAAGNIYRSDRATLPVIGRLRSGATWHWDGKQWKSVPTGAAEHLVAVWGSDSKDVWAGGAFGTALRWDGTAWRRWSTLNAIDNYTTIATLAGFGGDHVLATAGS